MGQTSKRLHARLRKLAPPLHLGGGVRRGRADIPSIEAWISEGMDPVHAAYAFVQNISSVFAEVVSQLPEMKAYARIAGAAEEEYLPSGPPMSPLTASFFTTWAFYDLRFDGTDTLASCLIEANDVVCMNPDQLDALKKLANSRMGVYEQIGMDGPHVRLRELLTDDEFSCHCASGHRGRSGELWYVRLLPPLVPDLARYHVAFTTPYILMAGKSDWVQFLQRSLMQLGSGEVRQLYRLLKYGPDANYWNEFVFKAYHHHRPDAIFLAGIPDLKGTLPHA
jgi:hypothetical protein